MLNLKKAKIIKKQNTKTTQFCLTKLFCKGLKKPYMMLCVVPLFLLFHTFSEQNNVYDLYLNYPTWNAATQRTVQIDSGTVYNNVIQQCYPR